MNLNVNAPSLVDSEPVDLTLRHYEDVLAAHYVWMGGASFDDQVEQQRSLLGGLGICKLDRTSAIDLGCGPGYQSLALADLGASHVLALDTCQSFLDLLDARKAGRPVEAVRSDIRALLFHAESRSVGTVVCMGDTLTELETRLEVSWLLAAAHVVLAPGGALVLTFCDYSSEFCRVKQVRADADRIMTCCLDYDWDKVALHYLIHSRGADGWRLTSGYHRKLRLDPRDISEELTQLGFIVVHDKPDGPMHAILARKPEERPRRVSVFLGGDRF